MPESEEVKWMPRLASKLVRDKIPGNRSCYFDLAEHFTLLCAKLFEEAAEVTRAKSKDELVEELADVIEVCLCIGEINHLSVETIYATQVMKRQEKGSFLGGVVQDGEWHV